VTLAAQDGAAEFWLERNVIVFAAVVANDVETFRRVHRSCRFFRAAFCAALRGQHIALVKYLLLLFSEEKGLLALNTRNFNVRHLTVSLSDLVDGYRGKSVPQTKKLIATTNRG
jgi:hypothetical protein